MPNANDHAQMLNQYFGVKVKDLGCVMLTFRPLPVSEWIPAKWAYTSEQYPWVKGLQVISHVTLLYGLLSKAYFIKPQVDQVLEGWDWTQTIRITGVGMFPAPAAVEEPYACIMANLDMSHLLEAHQRLSFLPHINTYPEYKAHLTLGYVRGGYADSAMELCKGALREHMIEEIVPTGLDYGEKIL